MHTCNRAITTNTHLTPGVLDSAMSTSLRCHLAPTNSTANRTTRSMLNQTRREPNVVQAAADFRPHSSRGQFTVTKFVEQRHTNQAGLLELVDRQLGEERPPAMIQSESDTTTLLPSVVVCS